jgi:hypothetical protein
VAKKFTDLVSKTNAATADILAIVDPADNTSKRTTVGGLVNAILSLVASKQDAWTAPTFSNSWVNFGSGYETAGYMRDSLGYVHLKGMIKTGAINSVAFTLPAGYRPTAIRLFGVISNNVTGGVEVASDGTVKPVAGNSAYVSLEGITFKAEA